MTISMAWQAILRLDPLCDLTDDVKATVWQHRYLLSHFPNTISKFLHSVRWNTRECVYEAYHLLHVWHVPTPVEALQVRCQLSCAFVSV